jgi:MFS family permease
MPTTHNVAGWVALRSLAGLTSALIFVIAVNSLLGRLPEHRAHLPGWAFGGIGAGIAVSGALVLALRSVADWRWAWWASAALAMTFTAASWNLRLDARSAPLSSPSPSPDGDSVSVSETSALPQQSNPHTHHSFAALFASYSLEGLGYIVAGTFLVAAIEQSSPGWLGSGAWVLVGLAAVPSAAFWAWLSRRWSRPDVLVSALIIQAIGIALPALIDGTAAALISAALFGATFLGVATVALATGAHLRFPRSVALLTAGYSVGQILGPLVVTPLLHHGYHQALLLAAAVVLAAATAAVVLRIGFPHTATQ